MFIQKLDFLGSKPEFKILGNSRSQTILGGTLSTIVVAFLLLGTYYFVNILFSRKNFTVVSSSVFDDQMFMNLTNAEYAFRIRGSTGQLIPDLDRIAGITGVLWFYKQVTLPDGRTDGVWEVKPFPLERCNSSKHFADSKNPEWKQLKYIDEDAYCFPRDLGLNLNLKYGNLNFTHITLNVHRCNNSTMNNNRCFPRPKIDKILENVLVAKSYRTFYFVHDNFGEPGKEYIENDFITSSSLLYKQVRYNYQTVKYITDGGYFLPEESEQIFKQLHTFRESVDLTDHDTHFIKGTFTLLNLTMGSFRQEYTRKYYKFQNMLADLGGILKGCVSIAMVINWIFCNRAYYNQIINQNFASLNHAEDEQINSTLNKINKNPIPRIEDDDGKPTEINMMNMATNPISQRDPINNAEGDIVTPEVSCLSSARTTKKIMMNITGVSSPSKTSELKNAKLMRKAISGKSSKERETKISFSCVESFLPLICFGAKSKSRKNLTLHFKLRQIINNQMDIVNIIGKLNIIDKLNFLIMGLENKSMINKCPNPYITEYKTNLTQKILNLEKIVLKRFKNYE